MPGFLDTVSLNWNFWSTIRLRVSEFSQKYARWFLLKFQAKVKGNSLGATPSTSSFLHTYLMSMQYGYFIALEYSSLQPVASGRPLDKMQVRLQPNKRILYISTTRWLTAYFTTCRTISVPPPQHSTISFIMVCFLVHIMLTFHINDALKLKCPTPVVR